MKEIHSTDSICEPLARNRPHEKGCPPIYEQAGHDRTSLGISYVVNKVFQLTNTTRHEGFISNSMEDSTLARHLRQRLKSMRYSTTT